MKQDKVSVLDYLVDLFHKLTGLRYTKVGVNIVLRQVRRTNEETVLTKVKLRKDVPDWIIGDVLVGVSLSGSLRITEIHRYYDGHSRRLRSVTLVGAPTSVFIES